MPFKNTIATARDIGNYAAGYVAGSYAIPWIFTRATFDTLEAYQHRNESDFNIFKSYIESNTSQSAQWQGFKRGQLVAPLRLLPFGILLKVVK